MDQKNTEPKKILAVMAHPDDETFGIGGTLALYASQGVEVTLICATRGEAGDVDPEFREKFQSAACLRTQELNCAARLLGIEKVIYLNYRDSGMAGSPDNHHPNALAGQPVENVAEKIRLLIDQVKPEVVITFDPIGGYRHPDHIAIHNATVYAFNQMVEQANQKAEIGQKLFVPKRLYFHVINRLYLRLSVLVLKALGKDPSHWGRNGDIDLASLADVNFPSHAKINYAPVAEIRRQAAACHASQGGAKVNKGVRAFLSKLTNSNVENFMQAYPVPLKNARLSRDLFKGL